MSNRKRFSVLFLIATATAASANHQMICQQCEVAPHSPLIPAPITGVNLTDHGAKCDGTADDTAAIVRGLADAKSKSLPLILPARRCNFSSVIHMDGVKMRGEGDSSILHAMRWEQAAIFLYGSAPSVSNVKLTGAPAPGRQAPWESTKITIFGASDFVIDRVTIEGSAAASIQTARAPTRGTITNNVIRNSLSDSIHMTDGASHILVEGNLIENSGDDGIAVVSYSEDATRVNNITVKNNIVRNNRHGRNMSVVGGSDIVHSNNLLDGNLSGFACLYYVREANIDFNTKRVDNVISERNTLRNCGSAQTGHAAAMIYADGAEPVNNVRMVRNDIVATQRGQNGIRYFGRLTNIRLEQNRYSGSGSAYVGGSHSGVAIIRYSSGEVGYKP